MKYWLTGLVALVASATAQAAIITFDLIEAGFFNPVGGNITLLDPTPPGTATTTSVRWGGDTTQPLVDSSGYDLVARATSFTENQGDTFGFATFTHLNQVIPTGTAIDSVQLRLLADFEVDTGTDIFSYTGEEFLFEFTHTETPNGANPCAFLPGDPDNLEVPGSGAVNVGGCSDLVEVQSQNDSFFDPVTGLTLTLEGFSSSIVDADNGIFFENFLSGEGSNNSAVLTGRFDIVNRVPNPNTLLLMGLGLIAVARARRV